MDSGVDAICELIQDTPEGFVVFVINSPQNPTEIMASTIKLEDFFTLTQDSSRFFIISMTIRCGWDYFMRHLELKHFPPMTKKNDLLVNFDFKWKGMPFSCVAVPKQFHAEISNSLLETNMKPIYGGVPTTVEDSGLVPMPVCADNCITVENGEDHIVYKNDAEASANWQQEQILKLEAETTN